ncbi:MAG: type VI secretion system protein TssA [Planctomycetes bacterium]|nr:type VI secretion system protein TssA [Planctomycetota bacterium]
MIDVSTLLHPIRPEAPSGADLRASTRDDVFVAVRELRRRDDPALMPEGVPPKEPDFRGVEARCRKVLGSDTKDLELAAYLTEAWTALSGFDGLAAGLELLAGLVEVFWADVWPGVERDGGQVEIVGPIRAKWVGWPANSRECLDTVRAVALTSGGAGELTLLDYEDARRMEDAQRTNLVQFEEMRKAGRTTPEQWATALAATPPAAIEAVAAGVARCVQALDRLEALANERLGDEAPSFRGLRELFDKLAALRAGGGPAAAAAPVADRHEAAAGSVAAAAPGALRSRHDATMALQQVARFLRANEPHSPVSFLVERCVRWLNMSFEEVMQDLVESNDTMSLVRKTLGITAPEEP